MPKGLELDSCNTAKESKKQLSMTGIVCLKQIFFLFR